MIGSGGRYEWFTGVLARYCIRFVESDLLDKYSDSEGEVRLGKLSRQENVMCQNKTATMTLLCCCKDCVLRLSTSMRLTW